MEPLLDHLGLAILGYHGIIRADIHPRQQEVSRRYRDDLRLFPHLAAHPLLRDHLRDHEIVLDDTPLADAVLAMLFHMFFERLDKRQLIAILTHKVEPRGLLVRLNFVLPVRRSNKVFALA